MIKLTTYKVIEIYGYQCEMCDKIYNNEEQALICCKDNVSIDNTCEISENATNK